jgi:hypothetical protein
MTKIASWFDEFFLWVTRVAAACTTTPSNNLSPSKPIFMSQIQEAATSSKYNALSCFTAFGSCQLSLYYTARCTAEYCQLLFSYYIAQSAVVRNSWGTALHYNRLQCCTGIAPLIYQVGRLSECFSSSFSQNFERSGGSLTPASSPICDE